MNAHTLSILEFDKLKSLLADFAVSSGGRAEIEELHPLTEEATILRKLDETSELRLILDTEGSFPLPYLHDVADELAHARISGTILSSESLFRIANVCRTSRIVSSFLKKFKADTPHLSQIQAELFSFKSLEEDIDRAIDPSGDILDSASVDLMRIRRSLQQKRNHVQDKLNALLQKISDTGRKDAYVTLREGRYVIPVRQDERGKIKGVVHDQSTSGATVFVEPMTTVSLNNDIRALERNEQTEIERILQELTNQVRQNHDRLQITYQNLVYLDVTAAKARFSLEFNCIRPEVSYNKPLDIRQGRHILLANFFKSQGDGNMAVANSLYFPDQIYSILITGPNTGGKTILLKGVGLIVLMAQTGLHVAADEGTTLPIFQQIFADIGDEQSLEQSLSTFSAHMNQIIHFVTEADRETLVLLDELGAGTDPEEGSALSMAILDHLVNRKALTLATTHYGVLKVYAHEHEHIINGSMEFDRSTLAPTYRFHQNLPGSSYALQIAERLGMPSTILHAAKTSRRAEDYDISKLISDLEAEQRRLAEEREKLTAEIKQQQTKTAKYEKKLAEIQAIRQESREKALKDAAEVVRKAKQTMKRAIRDIKKEQAKPKAVEAVKQTIVELEEKIDKEHRQITKKEPEPPVEKLTNVQVGDKVRLIDWKTDGEVIEVKSDAEVVVASGPMKINVAIDRLAKASKKSDARKANGGSDFMPDKDTISMELDLRGMRAEEAIFEVQKYLDNAYLSSLERVRLIHGKGTGALRKRISDYSPNHPRVDSFSLGEWNEGGAGVTVVKICLD